MIKVKEVTKLTPKVKSYFLTSVFLWIFFLSLVFSMSGNSNFFSILLGSCIIIGLPLYIYMSLWYSSISFVVDEKAIVINSGIIVKKSKIIPFDKIQNINFKQGIMMGFFGIVNFDIWTSSQSQIDINNGKSQNKPDGNLALTKEDAEWLRNYIMHLSYNQENIS